LKELLIRTLTGISLIIVVTGSMLAGPVPFLGILLVIFGLGTRELFDLYSIRSGAPQLLMALFAGMLLPAPFFVIQYDWSSLWFLIPVAGWIATLLLGRTPVASLMTMFWLAIPLGCFFSLGYLNGEGQYRHLLPMMVITLLWVNDTFAYLTGRILGRHPLTPKISPGKTWEGLIGGILFTMLGGYVFSRLAELYTPGGWIAVSLVISGTGLAGDLFESGLKRKRNVKDSGGILPGHGGVLDRFDSLLFVAPAMVVLFYLLSRWP
jgi:phosphatidate cytidylyltransferase